MDYSLLSEEMTNQMLTVHVARKNSEYGYGVWIEREEEVVVKYHVMGYDPGVSFHSGYYPKDGSILTVLSNKTQGALDAIELVETTIKGESQLD